MAWLFQSFLFSYSLRPLIQVRSMMRYHLVASLAFFSFFLFHLWFKNFLRRLVLPHHKLLCCYNVFPFQKRPMLPQCPVTSHSQVIGLTICFLISNSLVFLKIPLDVLAILRHSCSFNALSHIQLLHSWQVFLHFLSILILGPFLASS
jgi:hypothetical protein